MKALKTAVLLTVTALGLLAAVPGAQAWPCDPGCVIYTTYTQEVGQRSFYQPGCDGLLHLVTVVTFRTYYSNGTWTQFTRTYVS
jgi:hypothetical protein